MLVANKFSFGSSELWACGYGLPIQIQFPGGDYVRVQYPRHGRALTQLERRSVVVGARSGCISQARASIDFQNDFQQVVWRVSRAELHRRIELLTGKSCRQPITFTPELDFTTGITRALLETTNMALSCITPDQSTVRGCCLPNLNRP